MKNILITGGAGFIGSNLSIYLINKGYNITVLDNLSSQVHGDNQEESYLYRSIRDRVHFILGDVTVKTDWEKALKNQHAVIHLAAETGTGQSMYEISKYNNINIIGTANLLDLLTNTSHSIQKIILASSRSIYGEGRYFCQEYGDVFPNQRQDKMLKQKIFEPTCDLCTSKLILKATHEQSRISPASIYGITKYQQEQMVLLMGKVLNIPTISLRYQNVYGPGQALTNPYTGILSVFSTRLLNNNNIDIYEDGNQSRDFVYIEDVVNATTLALENEDGKNYIFNVGSGMPTTVYSVAKELINNYNVNQKIEISGKYRIGDIRHNYACLKKINKILGYKPKYDFKKGVLNFTQWVKSQKIEKDNYDKSLNELRNKGLIK